MTKVSTQTFARACKKRIQLGKTFYILLDFINRKYFTLVLKMKTILINCTSKFCYRHGIFQNTVPATGSVLKNFTKITGKHLCQSLFLNKIGGLRPATLLKKRLRHRCFPVNFVKFLRIPFLQRTVSKNMTAYIW